jgi:DNA-binding MarR family transcriptional regulator
VTADGDVLAEPLLTTFGRLVEANDVLTRRLGRSLEQRCGLPLTWFEVLLRIGRAEDAQVSMGSLAEQVALTSGGVTRLLDRMLQEGLVERVPCASDRRVSFAALTAQGRERLHQAAQVHVEELREVFAGFAVDELRTLDELLDRLRAPGQLAGSPSRKGASSASGTLSGEERTRTAGRRRRRAVGPAGAAPGAEPALDLGAAREPRSRPEDDERLLREVPPHHGG